MQITFNIAELQLRPVHLTGQIDVNEIDLEQGDGFVCIKTPITYRLTAALGPQGVRVQGTWKLMMECTCVRCLRPFVTEMSGSDWMLVLEVEEGAWSSDEFLSINLSTEFRDDIFLSLPRHPLCKLNECRLPIERLPSSTRCSNDCISGIGGVLAGGGLGKNVDRTVE